MAVSPVRYFALASAGAFVASCWSDGPVGFLLSVLAVGLFTASCLCTVAYVVEALIRDEESFDDER